MAKIQEQIIAIKLSKIAREDQEDSNILDDETAGTIESVVQELAGEAVVVEIIKD